MRNLILFSILLLLGVTSCQVDEAYHFNNDFSGTTEMSVDMTRYLGVIPDSTGKRQAFVDTLDLKIQSGLDNLNTIDGISNARFTWNEDSTVFSVAYDFVGLDELNAAREAAKKMGKEQKDNKGEVSASKEKEKKSSYGEFIRKGRKKLIYRHHNPTSKKKSKVDGFEKMFKVNLIFTFERDIKSVSHPKAQMFPNENKVIIDQAVLTDTVTDVLFELK